MSDLAAKARLFAQERRIGYAEHWDLLNELADEIERQGSKLDTLQKNYDLANAMIAGAKEDYEQSRKQTSAALQDANELRDELADYKERFRSVMAGYESRLISVEAELDEASPMRTCARCGKQDRSHRMAIEEGDEWECFPCWERCNAQERGAAKMLSGAGPGQLAPVVEGQEP